MRFVAAEAGFFPPGPLTLFADMVGAVPQTKQKWCHFRSTEINRSGTVKSLFQFNPKGFNAISKDRLTAKEKARRANS